MQNTIATITVHSCFIPSSIYAFNYYFFKAFVYHLEFIFSFSHFFYLELGYAFLHFFLLGLYWFLKLELIVVSHFGIISATISSDVFSASLFLPSWDLNHTCVRCFTTFCMVSLFFSIFSIFCLFCSCTWIFPFEVYAILQISSSTVSSAFKGIHSFVNLNICIFSYIICICVHSIIFSSLVLFSIMSFNIFSYES